MDRDHGRHPQATQPCARLSGTWLAVPAVWLRMALQLDTSRQSISGKPPSPSLHPCPPQPNFEWCRHSVGRISPTLEDLEAVPIRFSGFDQTLDGQGHVHMATEEVKRVSDPDRHCRGCALLRAWPRRGEPHRYAPACDVAECRKRYTPPATTHPFGRRVLPHNRPDQPGRRPAVAHVARRGRIQEKYHPLTSSSQGTRNAFLPRHGQAQEAQGVSLYEAPSREGLGPCTPSSDHFLLGVGAPAPTRCTLTERALVISRITPCCVFEEKLLREPGRRKAR